MRMGRPRVGLEGKRVDYRLQITDYMPKLFDNIYDYSQILLHNPLPSSDTHPTSLPSLLCQQYI